MSTSLTIENTIISLLLNFSLDNWDLHKEMMDLLDQPKPNQDKQFEQIEATFSPIEIPDSIRTIPNKMSPEARIKKLQWVQLNLARGAQACDSRAFFKKARLGVRLACVFF